MKGSMQEKQPMQAGGEQAGEGMVPLAPTKGCWPSSRLQACSRLEKLRTGGTSRAANPQPKAGRGPAHGAHGSKLL